MRSLVAGLFLALVAPGTVTAGAWARDDVNAFLSVTQTRTIWPRLTNSGADMVSFYGEYGFAERLTLGAKYDRREDDYGSFQGFARWHLRPTDARWQGAVEMGAGRLIAPGSSFDSVISLAGLVGAGFQWRDRNGWAEAELRQSWPLSDGTGWRNLDLTIGLTVTETVSGLVQARFYDDSSAESEALIVPTLLIEGPIGITTKAGVAVDPRRPENAAIEAGAWIEF